MADDDKTFTQDQLNAIVEERLKRERAKFDGYDDLKRQAEELAELKKKDQTAAQQAEGKLTAAEKRAAEAEAKAVDLEARVMRMEVASSKGLTSAQAKRLAGTSREELEKDAEELLETFGGNGQGGSTPRKPAEDLRGGGNPSATPAETDPKKLAESVPRY